LAPEKARRSSCRFSPPFLLPTSRHPIASAALASGANPPLVCTPSFANLASRSPALLFRERHVASPCRMAVEDAATFAQPVGI
jgi:hypothetical protein